MNAAHGRSIRRPGATTVEVAMVLIVFLLFVFGICEYGRFVMTRQLLDHAAREGVRFAIVHTYDATTEQIQDLVDESLGEQGRQLDGYDKRSSIEVFKSDPGTGNHIGAWTSTRFGDDITVRISGTYRPVLPAFLLLPSAIPVKSECIMKSEAN